MSIDRKGVRYCDGCGKAISKAHKIHDAHDYCSNCYPRIFPRVACSACGNSAHPHRNDPSPALCHSCLVANRKCIRCEKPVPRAALIVQGKAVCSSCTRYFKEQQTCAHCQQPSYRLSTVPAANITDKICDPCRNRFTHATCSVCRKYRKVVSHSPELGARCATCTADPAISHPCPDCGGAVAGNGNARCRGCANKLALDREINLTATIFTHEWTETLWRRFGAWLHNQRGASPKLISIVRSHQSYFERIDATFSSVLDLTGNSLLNLFGTSGLRTHLLPTRFLEQQLNVHFPIEAKAESSERARIDELARAAKSEPWEALMKQFLSDLDDDGLSLRSIRMYVSTASQFAREVELGDAAWSQGQIERFLIAKPGGRNNLSRFVSFCRQAKEWDVSMPDRGQALTPIKDPIKSAEKLAALIKRAQKSGLENVKRTVLEKIIATALGVSTREIVGLYAAQLQEGPEGLLLSLSKEDISLPPELEPYGRRLREYLC